MRIEEGAGLWGAILTRIEVERAKEAFEHAIRGDPADPLPRLGIRAREDPRRGPRGRHPRDRDRRLSLDPNNSLVRSYLGKAHFEEKRGGLVETELEQAELLDPEEPTPWFYEGLSIAPARWNHAPGDQEYFRRRI